MPGEKGNQAMTYGKNEDGTYSLILTEKENTQLLAGEILSKRTEYSGGITDFSLSASTKKRKEYKVVAVSENANNFGLRSMILIARDGEAWKAAANDLNLSKKGETLEVFGHDFSLLGFEIPERLPDAPPDVVKQVWGS